MLKVKVDSIKNKYSDYISAIAESYSNYRDTYYGINKRKRLHFVGYLSTLYNCCFIVDDSKDLLRNIRSYSEQGMLDELHAMGTDSIYGYGVIGGPGKVISVNNVSRTDRGASYINLYRYKSYTRALTAEYVVIRDDAEEEEYVTGDDYSVYAKGAETTYSLVIS